MKMFINTSIEIIYQDIPEKVKNTLNLHSEGAF